MVSSTRPREIIVVGDLHGHFDDEDRRFLEARNAELVVFIGDLGDEDPAMTRRVAAVDAPSRVLLGNHDAWESFRHDRATRALRESLDILGDTHFAYSCLDLDALGVSLVGCRPFSWGGPSLRSPELYDELYGVQTHADSAERIVAAAREAAWRDLVLIAHNGPRGLGTRPSDIYGKDFGRPGGDWGDLDLRQAIRELVRQGYRIPLVVAGHMHHRLLYPRGELRRRYVVKSETAYVNPARVPRIFRGDDGELVRHYLSVRVAGGALLGLTELYVSRTASRSISLVAREATA